MIEFADEAACEDFAVRLAGLARRGDVIGLNGPLGIGKTVFARAFIRSFTGQDETVPSPTYTLMQLYDRGGVPVYHYDLYRLDADEEIEELGFDEAVAAGIALIEWPERVAGLGGAARLDILFAEPDPARPGRRLVSLDPGATWRARLEKEFAKFFGDADD